jgi:hypothetical protein
MLDSWYVTILVGMWVKSVGVTMLAGMLVKKKVTIVTNKKTLC